MLKLKDVANIAGCKLENCDLSHKIHTVDIDSRRCSSGDIFVALQGKYQDGTRYVEKAIQNGAIAAVVNGSYLNENLYPIIRCQDPILFMAELSKLWRKKSKALVIGITGSNGKTTTKDILYNIAKYHYGVDDKSSKIICSAKSFNNHLGVPLSIFKIQIDTELAILELGTNNFGEIAHLASLADPNFALITNIGDSHLQFFKDKQGVLQGKKELFDYVINNHAKGKIFINKDDILLSQLTYNANKVKTFGINSKNVDYKLRIKEIDNKLNTILDFNNNLLSMKIFGSYNAYNALAAIALAQEILGAKQESIAKGIESFQGSENRSLISNYHNAILIRDFYNANPSSLQAGLIDFNLCKGKKAVVLADMNELGYKSPEFHKNIAVILNELDIDGIFLLGTDMKYCYDNLIKKNNAFYFKNLQSLKDCLDKEVSKYDIIYGKASRLNNLERIFDGI